MSHNKKRHIVPQRLTVATETTASHDEADYIRALVYYETLDPFARRVCMCKQTVGLACARLPMRPSTMATIREMIAEEKARLTGTTVIVMSPEPDKCATDEDIAQMRALVLDEMLDPLSTRIGICKQTIASFCAQFPLRAGTVRLMRQVLAEEVKRKGGAS